MTVIKFSFLSPNRRRFQALAIAVLLAAFALRVYHLGYQSLWRDEVDAIRFSGSSLLELLSALTQKGHNGPLYFVALHSWRKLTGSTEFGLRYFSVVGGTLMVALIYRVGRRLTSDQGASAVAALLAATSPYLIWYSQEAKMYTWLSCLVLAALYAYQKALSRPETPFLWWAIFVGASSLSFYTHILAPLMLGVYLFWALLQWGQVKQQLKGWSIAMLLLTLPYLPLLIWQAPLLLNGFDSGHPFYPASEQARLLLHFYSVGVLHSQYSLYLMGGAVFLALLGLFLSPTGPSLPRLWITRLQLATWLLIPPVAVYLISLQIHIFEDRYLIYIAPAYYLLIALGFISLMSRVRWSGRGVLLLLTAFNLWALYRQAAHPIKADFRAAAAYIARADENTGDRSLDRLRAGDGGTQYSHQIYLPLVLAHHAEHHPVVMIQMPYLRYTFDYYYQGPYRLLEGLWTNDDREAEEVNQEMQTRLEGVEGLWLIVSEEDYWDNRHLTRKWLDENAALQDEEHFTGVDVYRYEIRMTNDE